MEIIDSHLLKNFPVTRLNIIAAEDILQRAHTRAYMHTFGGVHLKYILEAVGVNYTFEAVGPLRAYTCIHAYVYNS